MPFDYPDQPVAGFLRFQGDVEVDAFTGETRIVNITVGPTTFGPVAAKTVFMNATNASAAPLFVAATAAFQHLRVNSANTGLEWAVLAVTSPITLTSDNIGFDQTVALGNNARVAVSKNSGATVGTRRRINFIEGSNVTITVADDAGNEEVDVTIASSGSGGSGGGTLPDGINLTATNETMEVAITGGGVADWEASFVDMLSGTGTEGSTTSNNFSSASNTVVAAPAASTQRTIVHASLYCITGGSFTIQKDVAGTDIVLIGPLTLAAGERAEFSEVGWKVYFADGSEKNTTATGLSILGGPGIPARFDLTHSPIALYNFDSSIADSSGNGFNFDVGTGDYQQHHPNMTGLAAGSNISRSIFDASLAIAGDVTIQIMGRMLTTGSAVVFINYTASGTSLATNTQWLLGVSSGNLLRWLHEHGVGVFDEFFSTTKVPLPNQTFYAAGVRASNVVTLYINGLPAGTSSLLTQADGGTSSKLAIAGSSNHALLGAKIIPSALTAAQIKAEYNRTMGIAYGLLP